RSMGTDTECDLAVEAETEMDRRTILRIRNRLIGEHCGVGADEVAAFLAGSGSLVAVPEQISRNGHSLRPVQDREPRTAELAGQIETVADPEQPIGAEAFIEALLGTGHGRRAPLLKIGLVAALILALALAWYATPLAQWADPDAVRASLAELGQSPWAPVLVVATFVAAGLVAFPVTVLIAATAAAFGAWPGLPYATIGVLASAAITYAVGARLGKQALRAVLGPRLNRVRRRIARQGVVAVATVRLVPLAPFTVVNL